MLRGSRVAVTRKVLPSFPFLPSTTSLKYRNLPIFSPSSGLTTANVCHLSSSKGSSPNSSSAMRIPESKSGLAGVGFFIPGVEYAPFPPNNRKRVRVSHFHLNCSSRLPPQSASKIRTYNLSLISSGVRIKITCKKSSSPSTVPASVP